MPMLSIKNDKLTVLINTYGAELTSIKHKSGKEFLWQGGPEWSEHAPVLFPIVSTLKDNKYTLDGKEYYMEAHGFASKCEFEVESQTACSVTMLLKSNSYTLSQYPFDFEFRIRFTLDGNKLCQEYITKNKSKKNMYYSAGSHEGYACPGGIDNYTLVFDEPETIERYAQFRDECGHICKKLVPYLKNEREIKLDYDFFADNELDFLDFKSQGIALRDDRTSDEIHISFPGFDTLVCWTRKGARAEYICIEPWCGTWDFDEYTPCDLSQKYRIRTLKPYEQETLTHTITFPTNK
ncbi:MAG: aldose 1-epimerase family protein [Oscillospiraceae bacterium]|nr:aldose 1-epimerase family protein [Oscillospiraceae bacterium]